MTDTVTIEKTKIEMLEDVINDFLVCDIPLGRRVEIATVEGFVIPDDLLPEEYELKD